MKKVICLLVICLALSATAFADLILPDNPGPGEGDLKTPPVISNLEIHDDNGGNIWLEVYVETPLNVESAIHYFENHEKGYNQAGYIGGIELQYSVDGKEWESSAIQESPNYDQDDLPWSGIFETAYLSELHVDSEVKAKARYTGADENGNERFSDWSNELVLNEKVDFKAHDWAKAELEEAEKLGVIPAIFKNEDLTQNITRREFAHIAVKLWEKISGSTVAAGPKDPFTDTDDPEVLKAYNLEITKGTSETTFDPDALITREQMATMMARALEKAKIDIKGYDPTARVEFKDHNEMHDWGMDPIYFMADREIIKGIGDGLFGVNGNATREAAILISVRCAKQFAK